MQLGELLQQGGLTNAEGKEINCKGQVRVGSSHEQSAIAAE